jgi:hypothetical protein
MKYFKYVPIENAERIAQEVRNTFPPSFYNIGLVHLSVDKERLLQIPELVTAIEKVKPIDHVGWMHVISFWPEWAWPHRRFVHIDVIGEGKSEWVLNFPIYNCVNTSSAFYKVNDEDVEILPGTAHAAKKYTVPTWSIDECEVIEQIDSEVDRAVLYNVTKPHCVINHTPEQRIILQVGFDKKFNWEK